jgi:hypothetical protein
MGGGAGKSSHAVMVYSCRSRVLMIAYGGPGLLSILPRMIPVEALDVTRDLLHRPFANVKDAQGAGLTTNADMGSNRGRGG